MTQEALFPSSELRRVFSKSFGDGFYRKPDIIAPSEESRKAGATWQAVGNRPPGQGWDRHREHHKRLLGLYE